MAHDIFISYSHKDKTTADAICSALEGRGMRCWYAPRDIAPGSQWAGAIIDAISKARIMVLVFTDFSNVSHQVLREVDNAVSSGVIILPFRLTDSTPTGEMKYYLATVHWLDAMNQPLSDAIEKLCSNAEAILKPDRVTEEDRQTPTAAPAMPAAEPQKKKKNTGLITGAVVGAAVLVLLALWLILPGTKTKIPTVPNAEKETSAPAVTEAQPSAVPESTVQEQEPDAGKSGPVKEAAADETAVRPEPASSEEPSVETSSEPTAAFSDMELDTLSSAENSAGAENYLYTVKGVKVQLDSYFGEGETVVTVPAVIEGKPVAWIGEKCFADKSIIEQVILPDTVEKIEYRAFEGCRNLKAINFPESLRSVGGWAFAQTGFEEVTLPETLTTLGYGAFHGCIHLTKVVLPSAVNNIGVDTFRSCPVLKNVVIPCPEVKIHKDAFEKDSGVTLSGAAGSSVETYCKGMSLAFEEYVH